MVDTTVEGSPTPNMDSVCNSRFSCSPEPGIDYSMYMLLSGAIEYRKFSGGSWAAGVSVQANLNRGMTLYYDQWTKNVTTNLMLMLMCDTAADDGVFNALDLDDDTLDGEQVMFAGVTASPVASGDVHQQSIVRAESGRIYAFIDIDGGTEVEFAFSDNEGVTWTSAATAGLFEVVGDRWLLVPLNEADLDDVGCVYYDESAGELTLKVFDATAGTWSESAAILSGLSTSISVNEQPIDAAQRHSDGHIIAVVATNINVADNDLKVVDITDATTFSTLTDVLTDVDDFWLPRICIDQITGDLRVSYAGSADGSGVLFGDLDIHFQTSTDGGSSWDGETTMSEDVSIGTESLSTGVSIDLSGGDFLPIWFNESLDDVMCNLVNRIEIAAAPPAPPAGGRAGRFLPPGWGGPAPPPRGTGGPGAPSGAPPGTAPGYGKTHPQTRARQLADAVCLDQAVAPARHQSLTLSLVQLLHCLQGRPPPRAPQSAEASLNAIFVELGISRPRRVTLAQELDIIAAHLP